MYLIKKDNDAEHEELKGIELKSRSTIIIYDSFELWYWRYLITGMMQFILGWFESTTFDLSEIFSGKLEFFLHCSTIWVNNCFFKMTAYKKIYFSWIIILHIESFDLLSWKLFASIEVILLLVTKLCSNVLCFDRDISTI